MGVVYDAPELDRGEKVLLRLGAGFFPSKALFSHGGLLYLTNQRLFFRPHKFDKALARSDSSMELRLDEISGVGSTPRWSAALERRFLRVDAGSDAYLFLFSVRHPTWRGKTITGILQELPTAVEGEGWGVFT